MAQLNKEIIEKAKKVRNAEELLVLCKENNIDLLYEEATLNFAELNPKIGELLDEELDNVNGGKTKSYEERLRDRNLECPRCHNKGIDFELAHQRSKNLNYECKHCGCQFQYSDKDKSYILGWGGC